MAERNRVTVAGRRARVESAAGDAPYTPKGLFLTMKFTTQHDLYQ